MPKVSIVIPVYNQVPYLAACLDSVLAQTLRDIEIICVDDGATDGSKRLLEGYAARDSRIRVFRQRNAGAGRARNRGIGKARGEFIAFMDSDDMYPDAHVLEDMYSAAVANGAQVCGGSFMEFLPNGAERTKYEGTMSGMTFSQDGFVNYRDWQFDYGFYRFIYRQDLLESAKIRFPRYLRYQDPPFLVRAMYAAERFYALKRVVYRFRVDGKEVNWRGCAAIRFKALCAGLCDVAEFARTKGLDRLAELQRERVLHDFGDLFFDDELCRMAWWRVWRLFKALGFRCRVRRWHVWLGMEPSSLVSYDVKRPEPIPGDAAERLRRLYVGDLVNFGKAYADGMKELRSGGKKDG